jgi:DNA-binding response OmpR family regulator
MQPFAPEGPRRELASASILVVEDDFLIGLQLKTVLEEAGAEVIGPFRTGAEALASLRRNVPRLALLDIRLEGETAGLVAEELARRGVPLAFYTGQLLTDPICANWPSAPIIGKPAPPEAVVQVLAALLFAGGRQPGLLAG